MVNYKSFFLLLFFLIIGNLFAENRGQFAYDRIINNHYYCLFTVNPGINKFSGFRSGTKPYRSHNFTDRIFDNNSALSLATQTVLSKQNNEKITPDTVSSIISNAAIVNEKNSDNQKQIAELRTIKLVRQKKREQNQRYNQEVRKRLKNNNTYLENYIDYCKDQINSETINPARKVRLQERASALIQSQSNIFAPTLSTYTLTDQAKQLAQKCYAQTDVFSLCHGSLIQQQIHQEVVDILNKTATIYFISNQNQSALILSKTIGQLAVTAIEHNNQGHIAQAITLTDCCQGLFDCALGIGDGAIDGVVNVANAIAHPADTLTELVHTAANAAFFMGKVLYEICDISLSLCYDKEARLNKLDQNLLAVNKTIQAINAQVKNMTIREKARIITSTIVEIALTKKCLRTIGTFYNKAQTGLATISQSIESGLQPRVAFAGMPPVAIATQGAEYGTLFAESNGGVKAENRLLSLFQKKPPKSGLPKIIAEVAAPPNIIKVNNMKEFFNNHEFGKLLKQHSVKTNKRYKGQSIYQLTADINDGLQEGYQFYLDSSHWDHLEVFTKKGKAQSVFNLDGTRNIKKTTVALKDARII